MKTLYNKLIAYTVIGAILAVPAMALADSNSTLTDSAPATTAAVVAPSTGDTSSTAVSAPSTGAPATTATAPSTGDSSSTAGPAVPPTDSAPATTAAPAAPSTGSAASTAAPATPSTGNTSSTAGPAPVVETPAPTPAPATGGGVSFGGSSGGSSGGYSSGGGSYSAPVTPGQCAYLFSTLKFGGNNPATEVSKLQVFLKTTQELDVDVTGNYDQKTFDAVKAFQTKYASDILAPWGVTTPTGNVYITTKNKIDGLYCHSNVALTASQLSEINAYKNSAKATTTVESQINSSNSIPLSPTTTPDVGVANQNSQVAAVANTSFFGKIWSFVKHIFGR